MEVSQGYIHETKDNFLRVNGNHYFGLVLIGSKLTLPGIRALVKKGKHFTNRESFTFRGYHVKKLGLEESRDIPARRFHNSVMISKIESAFGPICPKPKGLIYGKNAPEVLVYPQNIPGYFVSQFISGDNLMTGFSKLSKTEREILFAVLGGHLRACREKGVYLMDFAPRDIVLYPTTHYPRTSVYPFIVDTEHVDFVPTSQRKAALERQIEQFHSDYSVFYSRRELAKLERVIFGKKK